MWFTVHWVDIPHSWLLFDFIIQCLEQSDFKLNGPHSSLCTLPTAFCTLYAGHNPAVCCRGQDFKCKGSNPILTLVHHPLHTAHGHCVLHTAPVQEKEKQAQCISGARVECVVVWFTVHWVDLLHNWLLLNSITEVGFLSAQTDSNLSVPPTSLRILLLHFAHCTPTQAQCTASGRIIRWLLVHSHRSVICKGIHVSPEGSLLQLLHFGIFWFPCPLAAGRSS